MSKKATGLFGLVLIPAILTLAVTVLRLYGELQGWDPLFFSNDQPGVKDQQPGLVGIAYLVPIFGIYFGFRLRRATGQPAKLGRSTLLFAIGIAVMAGGVFGMVEAGLISLPSEEAPGEATGLEYALAPIGAAVILALIAWPRIVITLLVYGLLARIPVLVVTWLAVENGWDVHYAKLPVGVELPAGASKLPGLMIPQVSFWIVFTILFGGLFGCLGAKMAKKK